MSDGRPDPCGLVKGWAAERAWRVLRGAGAADVCVNAGGDVRVGGAPGPAGVRRTGIADPRAMVLGAGEAHRWIASLPGYALLTVAADGEARASVDFPFAPSG